MSEKLLIVEDDKKLNDGIRLALRMMLISFISAELCRKLEKS